MRITLQAAVSHWSEAAVHSHPFLKISPENAGVSRYFCHVTKSRIFKNLNLTKKADRNFRRTFLKNRFRHLKLYSNPPS